MLLIAQKSQTISDFRVPTVEETRESRKKRIIINVLSVYGDDSSDDEFVKTYCRGYQFKIITKNSY
jgi:hypothetical protein